MDITSSTVVPTTDRIDEPGRIELAYAISEPELCAFLPRSLTPVLVVDHLQIMYQRRSSWVADLTYPCDNTWVALELLDHELELPPKFLGGILMTNRDVSGTGAFVIGIPDIGT